MKDERALLALARNEFSPPGSASTSRLARKLGIGWNAANRLMQHLEREGKVSAPNRDGIRQIEGKISLDEDIAAVAGHAETNLLLEETKLTDDYFYRSLPLCVINAVFSIGVRYESVQAVVANWCSSQNPPWTLFQNQGGVELSVSAFLAIAERYSPDELADQFFHNRQRTSSRSGILKAQAVVEFAIVLRSFNIEVFSDVLDNKSIMDVESDIRNITGQRSGISFEYFLMLAGGNDYVKADRMVQRFVASALGLKDISTDRARQTLKSAAYSLKPRYPNLTPRALDFAVWNYQRLL